MKDRAYRRYMEEVIVLKRMRNHVAINSWYRYEDINKIKHAKIKVKDLINTSINFMYKTYTTDSCDSKNKIKYSSNRNLRTYYNRRYRNTRLNDKHEFRKLLKEYGIQ